MFYAKGMRYVRKHFLARGRLILIQLERDHFYMGTINRLPFDGSWKAIIVWGRRK